MKKQEFKTRDEKLELKLHGLKDLYVRADTLNWILSMKDIDKKTGKLKWTNIAYFSSIDALKKYAVNYHLRVKHLDTLIEEEKTLIEGLD